MSVEDMRPFDEVVAVEIVTAPRDPFTLETYVVVFANAPTSLAVSVTAPVLLFTDVTGAEVINPLSFWSWLTFVGIVVESGNAPTSVAESTTAPVLLLTEETGALVRNPESFCS